MLRIAGLLFGIAIASSISEAGDINVTAIYAMDADGRNVREVTSIQDYPIINSPEISPDGKWIAVDGWKTGESLTDARVLLVNIEDRSAVDLGQGASRADVEQRGEGQVYLDFLLKIDAEVRARGHTMQFWGDIIIQHPELIAGLPRDTIALGWGYEADHPFDEHGAQFAGHDRGE